MVCLTSHAKNSSLKGGENVYQKRKQRCKQPEEGEEEDVKMKWGRRKSGYGHTAVQHIIIGFVRQHLLCQHSSRQPGGRWSKNRMKSPAELRIVQDRKKQGQIQRNIWEFSLEERLQVQILDQGWLRPLTSLQLPWVLSLQTYGANVFLLSVDPN